MSKNFGGSRTKDLETIAGQLAKPKPLSKVTPTVLPLSAVRMWPNVFQHRRAGSVDSKRHILKLADAIKRSQSQSVDPITVWWDGRGWACVDGHHRHEAYKVAEVASGHAVPVTVFVGTVAQAMAVAAGANSKDKLAMTASEKSDAAWHLTVATEMSKAEVASKAKVSESSVANMRRVRDELKRKEAAAPDLEVSRYAGFMDLRWTEALRLNKGLDAPDFDRESADERKAQVMALKLRQAIGDEGAKFPEVMARALEIYDSRLPDQLAEWWSEPGDDEEESEGEAVEV